MKQRALSTYLRAFSFIFYLKLFVCLFLNQVYIVCGADVLFRTLLK